jgi:hypothetical protein
MVKLKLPSAYLVENPQAYRIGGRAITEILTHIQPGDILLRGYDGYVDGVMIRKALVCSEKQFEPGWFTMPRCLWVNSSSKTVSMCPRKCGTTPKTFNRAHKW